MKSQIDADNTQINFSAKTLRGVILWGLSSMLSFGIATVTITSTLKDIQKNQEKYNEINSIQVEALKVTVKALEIRVNNLETDVKVISSKLSQTYVQ